eukprot:COSAG04_NODE_2193_length_4561_cov_46.389960_3_plen_138_part_00
MPHLQVANTMHSGLVPIDDTTELGEQDMVELAFELQGEGDSGGGGGSPRQPAPAPAPAVAVVAQQVGGGGDPRQALLSQRLRDVGMEEEAEALAAHIIGNPYFKMTADSSYKRARLDKMRESTAIFLLRIAPASDLA